MSISNSNSSIITTVLFLAMTVRSPSIHSFSGRSFFSLPGLSHVQQIQRKT
ncbi:MAG: hypothetical protein E6J34_20355 [Chloroflexi bacterium]|nr:MAG: hypothetical protein E6J34_20355 [Chloroflexota bacterium]